MDTNEVIEQILADLRSTDRLKRRHASFWNFVRKGPKEIAVFTEAMRRIECDVGESITSWSIPVPDPPDIVVTLGSEKIGIEITELVNPKALRAQLHVPERYGIELIQYGAEEAKSRLKDIISEKESKLVLVGDKYDRFILLVHTDEPTLSSDQFRDWKVNLSSSVFCRAYLLFSYEPAYGECPLVCIHG
ncbi:MAG: hypothetical protein ACOY95_00390 [Pseudomonadota bacterium]